MSRIYNAESLKIMTLFEKITRTRIKDYFIDDNNLQTFVVDEIVLGKAIGKQAVNVKKLQKLLNSKIRIVGFSNNPEKSKVCSSTLINIDISGLLFLISDNNSS